MTEPESRWEPRLGDGDLIWRHLLRQRDVPDGWVRLDDARVVREGGDADDGDH